MLKVAQFKLPHKSVASVCKFWSTLDAPKGALVWGITDGHGHWFRHCWLTKERAEECLAKWGKLTLQSIAVNVCTDTTYVILTA